MDQALTDTSQATRSISIRYFAWVREKTGIGSETVEIGPEIGTIAGLITFLASRGPEFQAAFASPTTIRAAIDMKHVKHEAAIAGAREIAFFPPVTGG